MANTIYRECWWLVQALTGEFSSGGYMKGQGYSLRNLNDLRPPGLRIHYEWYEKNENAKREKDNFRHQVKNWRANIYNEFGLAMLTESTPGPDDGEGGYYYYLANPELLDEDGRTLREHIEFLAESETNRDDWVKPGEINEHYRRKVSGSYNFVSSGRSSSLGFLSGSNTTSRISLGEENLILVQFSMQFGEVLTIKFGKVRNGIDINAPYSFEPYQLKEIEGRWYVIGNLYPLGHKEQSELAIYDLARLRFSDEENPDILFDPVKEFDINEHILLDAASKRRMEGVRPIDIITHTEEFADYLRSHPFCSAQEEIADGTFRIYINLTNELIVQFGAYGNEISIGLISKDGDEEQDRYLIRKALNYFRKSEE